MISPNNWQQSEGFRMTYGWRLLLYSGKRRNQERGEGPRTIQECPRWHTVRAPHGMPLECTPEGVWIRVDGSSRIPEVGRRGRLREDLGQTPPEVRRRQGNQVVGSKPGGTRHHDLTLLRSQGNDL